MRINLAGSAGFCFGVKRALNIALETAVKGKNVFMLGDIVHNEDVVNQVKLAGIKKIGHLTKGKNRTLLLRAHGAALKTLKKAKSLGYRIVDATCPKVKEIHQIVKEMDKLGYRIIVIGDKNHDEVQGIIGQIQKKAIVIDNLKNIPPSILNIRNVCVVSQSTQNLDKVQKIVGQLKKNIGNLRFFNTICRPTQLKQKDILTMPLKNNIMIVIGSKNSANTKRLYEISKSLNKKSYWVNSYREIKPYWFKGVKKIGITSGASTPDSTTQEIIKYIKTLEDQGDRIISAPARSKPYLPSRSCHPGA